MVQGYLVMNKNDEIYKKYKKNRINKIIFVILGIGIIVLEVLALFNIISMFWGIGVFILLYVFKFFYLK